MTIHAVADSLALPAASREDRLRGVLKVDPAQVGGAERGKVVLVTAMTPTPAGEGKTTTVIGLVDGLRRRGVAAVGALREPSLGPLFGVKGGAVGGGKSRVEPAEPINLHFTGDIHAVTSAHDLLAALVDNHLFHGLCPAIDTVTWGRVLDMNDRALRRIQIELAGGASGVRRVDITASSEVMAILCLSRDLEDLRARLDRIVVGASDGRPVTAADVHAGGAMAAVLLDAVRPNLVQTLEGSPVFIHGGPFANVAQGTSSLMQTRLARRVADVVVTEAGFAFDLGGFKFMDLKARAGGFDPAAVVLVATVRALRFHGEAEIGVPNVAAVAKGLQNVVAHVEAARRLGIPSPIVCLNRFPDDSPEELAEIRRVLGEAGVAVVDGFHFAKGGEGALELADAVAAALAGPPPAFRPPYDPSMPVVDKVRAVVRTVLGGTDVVLTAAAERDLALIEQLGLAGLPICLAKTHLSISDDPKVRGRPAPFTLKVSGITPAAGAGFLVIRCGPILTMPGLPARPAAHDIDVEKGPDGWHVRGLK